MRTYELNGQKFKVIGKSSQETPPKAGMWIVCSENQCKVPGRIIPDGDGFRYRTRDGANTFSGDGGAYWNSGTYSILEPVEAEKRNHKNTKRLTARERTVAIIKAGALAADIERQLQLHVKAALKRNARQQIINACARLGLINVKFPVVNGTVKRG